MVRDRPAGNPLCPAAPIAGVGAVQVGASSGSRSSGSGSGSVSVAGSSGVRGGSVVV